MEIKITESEDGLCALYMDGEHMADFDTIDEAIHYAETHGEKVENDGV